MTKARPKLAVVSSHVIQHFAPVYRYIAQSGLIDLRVFYLAENGANTYRDAGFGVDFSWDVPLTDGYQYEFVEPGRVLDRFEFSSMDSKFIRSKVASFEPDYIWLHGYGMRANWRVLLRKLGSAKIIYWSDSNLTDSRSALRKFIKSKIVRFFLAKCDYFLSISNANTAYLQHYGVTPSQIVETTFPIDTQRFAEAQRSISKSDQAAQRKKLGVPPAANIILFAGKLVDYKRPADAIKALAEPHMEDLHLIIVGSGDLQQALVTLVQNLALTKRVHFCGFVNQSHLPLYFSIADLLVFPSEKEPYGAIAAETLSFGLPIVASDRIGALGSSIFAGQNGLVYPVGNVPAMAKAIRDVLKPENCKAFGDFSRSIADAHDHSVMARAIIRICSQP
ncbi:MAG: glycosyltransferase family 4 protein [Gammaproteobacteria bacterium]|nr:glycosyltransferase family 4 protein [Gammaproteobacteria bacterium]